MPLHSSMIWIGKGPKKMVVPFVSLTSDENQLITRYTASAVTVSVTPK